MLEAYFNVFPFEGSWGQGLFQFEGVGVKVIQSLTPIPSPILFVNSLNIYVAKL